MSILRRHVGMPGSFTYYVSVPDEIETLENLPIIVFLHGFGERGDDPALILNGGLQSLFESLQLPAIVIFPQCDYEHRAFYGAMEDRVLRAIEDSRQAFNASTSLVYLTGYSMGASSCLLLAARHPQMFRAMICVAVGITWPESYSPPHFPNDENQKQLFESMFVSEHRIRSIAEKVNRIPIWFLHGALDSVCPTIEARCLKSELERLGAAPKFTEFESLGHDVLLPAFQTEGLFEWLLAL